MDVLEQIIFFDSFFRDVGEFDVSVFRAGETSLEIFLLCKSWKIEHQDEI